MVQVKPFAALRPPRDIVGEVAARPYDVLNSSEAFAEAGEKSLLHITRPEIDFSPFAEEHSPEAYAKAVENFSLWQERGWLRRDGKPCYYIYAQTMDGRTQYGIVLCAHTDDYASGKIKKHELTRKDKEDDRMVHINIQSANMEPVFFAYPDNAALESIVEGVVKGEPEYDFVTPDGIGHSLWVIDDDRAISEITGIFESEVDALYVSDGHHRTAAAARVGLERRNADPSHDEKAEYNWFMAVCFPSSQLKIIDYNRLVRDLGGLVPTQVIGMLGGDFDVMCMGTQPYRPSCIHEFSMYLGGKWYKLNVRPGRFDADDPVGALDVTILSRLVLDKIFGIKDLRTDSRIDFVGGIRGLGELSRRVDSGEMAAAFALYPVSMGELVRIADTGNIMPPKTTWFEPKLRSGLTIHTF
ncbi:MAG: DUF1015 family protein [Bacteroidales bacterium]|nr:DUF1015 family protein [Bacteroidales bacterium]